MLDAYPDEPLAVYAVWFNMIPGDRKSRWNPDLLNNKRVRHYWDEERELGRWIAENASGCDHLGRIDWDSYYLFNDGAEWKKGRFPDPVACGTPIVNTAQELNLAISEVFDNQQQAESIPDSRELPRAKTPGGEK